MYQLKLYKCLIWVDDSTHGGDIDIDGELSLPLIGIFDDVTDGERTAGATAYRKVWVKNPYPMTILTLKAWFVHNTRSPNDTVSINAADGTTSDTAVQAAGYTFVAPATEGAAATFPSNIAPYAAVPLWLKRVVDAASDPYTKNQFRLRLKWTY